MKVGRASDLASVPIGPFSFNAVVVICDPRLKRAGEDLNDILRYCFTLRYIASLSLIFVTHSLIFMCSLKVISGDISFWTKQNAPCRGRKNAHWGRKKRTSQTDAGRWSQTSLFHYTAPPVRITWYTCEDSRDRTKKKKIKSRFKILLPWACRAPCADSGSGFYKHPSRGQESPPEPGWLDWWKNVKKKKWRSDRATTWVQEPVGFLPADQVALGELFTASDL